MVSTTLYYITIYIHNTVVFCSGKVKCKSRHASWTCATDQRRLRDRARAAAASGMAEDGSLGLDASELGGLCDSESLPSQPTGTAGEDPPKRLQQPAHRNSGVSRKVGFQGLTTRAGGKGFQVAVQAQKKLSRPAQEVRRLKEELVRRRQGWDKRKLNSGNLAHREGELDLTRILDTNRQEWLAAGVLLDSFQAIGAKMCHPSRPTSRILDMVSLSSYAWDKDLTRSIRETFEHTVPPWLRYQRFSDMTPMPLAEVTTVRGGGVDAKWAGAREKERLRYAPWRDRCRGRWYRRHARPRWRTRRMRSYRRKRFELGQIPHRVF